LYCIEVKKAGGLKRSPAFFRYEDLNYESNFAHAIALCAFLLQKQGWIVISMKTDWNRIFAFEENQN